MAKNTEVKNKKVEKVEPEVKISTPSRSPSRFVLGSCQFNRIDNVNKFISQCIDLGITTIDTGWGYGGSEHFSEKLIGQYLKKNRDKIYLIDKLPLYCMDPQKYKTFDDVLNEQLSVLGTDYIDCYMLHAVYDANIENQEEHIQGAIEFLKDKKKEGKIGSIGFSAHVDIYKAEHLLNLTNWDACMFTYNVLSGPIAEHYKEINVWQNPGKEAFQIAKNKGIHTYSMMPLESGRVLDISHDQNFIDYAFRYVKNEKSIDSILLGSSKIEHIKRSIYGEGDSLK